MQLCYSRYYARDYCDTGGEHVHIKPSTVSLRGMRNVWYCKEFCNFALEGSRRDILK